MNAPSGTTVAMRPAAGAVHVVYSTDPARPWEGVSPIRRARLSAALVSSLETRLSEEAGASTGRVLPFPDTGADAGDGAGPLATLRADLAALKGKTALVLSMATGWGEGRAGTPLADWKAHRIGADPPAALVSLRGDAERAILAACWLQPELAYGGGQAAALREAYRQFVHLSVAPMGKAVAAELALKLEAPGLAFDWSGLMAADVASKARAFQALTGGGMDAGAVAAAAGLEVQAMAPPATCSTCRAFLLYPQHHSQAGDARFGECRRRAPAAGTDNRFRGHATWPMVKATEWCERHVEAPSEYARAGPGGMVAVREGPMRSRQIAAAALAACTGDGGGPPVTSMPPTPAPAPTPTPEPDPEPEPRGDLAVIKRLIAGGANPNARREGGGTPLHVAAVAGDLAVVEKLIAGGADPNAHGAGGATPLHPAALDGDPAVVEALLAGGADPKARDKDGKTPFYYAKDNKTLQGTDVYWRLNEARFQ